MNPNTLLNAISMIIGLILITWTVYTIIKTDGLDYRPEDFKDDDFLKPY